MECMFESTNDAVAFAVCEAIPDDEPLLYKSEYGSSCGQSRCATTYNSAHSHHVK